MQIQSEALTKAGITHKVVGDPTLFDILFTDSDCVDYRSAKHRDPLMNDRYNAVLRANGILKAPGKLYPCLALTEADLDQMRGAVVKAAAALTPA
jgi:glutamate-1-semialdehyde 2,1-aminomutase